MAPTTRLFKSFSRLLLPIVLLVVAVVVAGSVWLTYTTARPVRTSYIVTPQQYGLLSTRASQVTDESWTNKDGSTSRGWLLRGAEGAPAVVLLHKYGADRSYVLNLGVKLNESTNFTVLMPDLRGHGENPPVSNASFGGCESEDTSEALAFLRSLKTANQISLVGKNMGIFGIEMGAMVAINTAAKDPSIKALAVDSIPSDSDEVLRESVERRFPFASFATTRLAKLGTYLYFFDGCYQRQPLCEAAKGVASSDVLVLGGVDAQNFQESSSKLSKCFPTTAKVTTKTDLSPSGFGITNASMEQSEAYDQRLIDFFRNSLVD